MRMFEIDVIQSESGLRSKAVVDPDRQLRLVRVAGHGPHPGDAFVFSWEGRLIPFDSDTEQVTGAVGGVYYRTILVMFGGSQSAENAVGVLPFAFSGPDERDAALRLVIESLLVYGSNYDGLEKPDGYHRVQAFNREWRLSDFGIMPVVSNRGLSV